MELLRDSFLIARVESPGSSLHSRKLLKTRSAATEAPLGNFYLKPYLKDDSPFHVNSFVVYAVVITFAVTHLGTSKSKLSQNQLEKTDLNYTL